MNELDLAMQQAYPVVIVPAFGELEAMAQHGMRFLLAGSGVWIEVRLSWLHVRLAYAPLPAGVPSLPYGDVQPLTRFTAGALPISMIRRFIDEAQQDGGRVECAALISHHPDSGWCFHRPDVISRSSGHVTYVYPDFGEGATLAVDLHSHGASDAYFSERDNADDSTQIKVAITVGHCSAAHAKCSVRARLCVRGRYLDMTSKLIDSLERVSHGIV